jgi:hypothetical protein
VWWLFFRLPFGGGRGGFCGLETVGIDTGVLYFVVVYMSVSLLFWSRL